MYSYTNQNAYRRSLPLPPPVPPQPSYARLSMGMQNYVAPPYQTMPIRTQRYAKPENLETNNQVESIRPNNFTSFGKVGSEEAIHAPSQLDFNYKTDMGGCKSCATGHRKIVPIDQRRSPYQYNEVLADPSTDFSSPDDNLKEAIKTMAIIENDRVNDHDDMALIELPVDENDADDQLKRNTLFNANLMGSSTGTLDI